MNQLKIVLAEYINRNLGDTIIGECAKFLVEDALCRLKVKNYQICEYNMYYQDEAFIKNADVIVFAGGGLVKYKRERFWEFIPEILKVAEENNIPVFMNAVGVEGYDDSDARCQVLKEALNLSCLKGITVRDDFELLKSKYIMSSKEWLEPVFDSAVFASKVYGNNSDLNKSGKNKIGIGIARSGLYVDYGYTKATKEYQLDFWSSIIHLLDAQGIQWEIFGNGLKDDLAFEKEVLKYSGISDYSKIVNCPAFGRELYLTICGYTGIIATRLHSNILAFSAGVPSIGLVWNMKLSQFGERIGYPERFYELTEKSPEEVVNDLLQIIRRGVQIATEQDYNTAISPLENFLGKYLSDKQGIVTNNNIIYEKVIAAHALGGLDYKFAGTNSELAFIKSSEKGYKIYETDVKLTSDGEVVCVNGWNAKTKEKLGVADDEGIFTYDEFLNLQYYDSHFSTLDFAGLVKLAEKYADYKFILDVRYNSEKTIPLIKTIKEMLARSMIKQENFIFQLTDVKSIKYISKNMPELSIMFDIPSEEEIIEYNIKDGEIDEICRKDIVKAISLRKNIMTTETIDLFKQYDKPICAFVLNTIDDIIFALKNGVGIVETDYIEVGIINALLQDSSPVLLE